MVFPTINKSNIVIPVLSLVAIAYAIAFMFWYYPQFTFDGAASEAWAALADDLRHGTFYRPIVSELGYGGTRYMPLFFSVYTVFIDAFGNHLLAGYAAMQISVLFAAGSVYYFARVRQLSHIQAIAFAGTICASSLYQQYLTDINCDYFSIGCAIFGLVHWQKSSASSSIPNKAIAVVFFTGAFLSKFSAIYAPAAIALVAVRNRQWKDFLRFCLMIAAAFVVATALSDWLSQHNMAKAFAVSWDGGLIEEPRNFLWDFLKELFFYQPFLGVLFVGTLLVLWRGRSERQGQHVAYFFIIAALVTLAIHVSPGISGNHMVAVHLSCILVHVANWHTRARKWIILTHGVLLFLLLATFLPGTPSVRSTVRNRAVPVAEFAEMCEKELRTSKPVMSTSPSLLIFCGKRPFIPDNFQFELLLRRSEAVRSDFGMRIQKKFFDVIITGISPPEWPPVWRQHYKETALYPHFRIYRPHAHATNKRN